MLPLWIVVLSCVQISLKLICNLTVWTETQGELALNRCFTAKLSEKFQTESFRIPSQIEKHHLDDLRTSISCLSFAAHHVPSLSTFTRYKLKTYFTSQDNIDETKKICCITFQKIWRRVKMHVKLSTQKLGIVSLNSIYQNMWLALICRIFSSSHLTPPTHSFLFSFSTILISPKVLSEKLTYFHILL